MRSGGGGGKEEERSSKAYRFVSCARYTIYCFYAPHITAACQVITVDTPTPVALEDPNILERQKKRIELCLQVHILVIIEH